jgi:hypothetical protein
MQAETLYAVGALALALVALLIYHVAVVRPVLARLQGLLAVHDELISADAGSASGRLRALEEGVAEGAQARQRLGERVTELESLAGTDLSRHGFVRYDAFTDSGAGLSYALALLNRQGDGVVLTSIYSREDTRTYGKPVAKFKPTVQASAEELDAIERARQATS